MRLRLVLALLVLSLPAVSFAGTSSVVFLLQWTVPGTPWLAPYDGPFDVAAAPDGTLLVTDLSKVQRYTATGVLLDQWQLGPVGNNANGTPSWLAIDDGGNAYINAGSDMIQKVTLGGVHLDEWSLQPTPPNQGISPSGIAVGSDGNVFVSDHQNQNIQKFSPDGDFLLRWDCPGVYGLAADRAGRIYAGDGTNCRVQVFDLAGTPLFGWGAPGTANGEFEILTDLAIGASGNVFVCDEFQRRVQEFAPDGSFVGVVGSFGTGEGQFEMPAGIGTDGSDHLFVADILGSRVEKFGPASVPATPSSWGRVKAAYRR